MKSSIQVRGTLLAALLAVAAAPQAFSIPVAIGTSAFSSSTTIVDFDAIPDQTPITNQYSDAGVTFSGALFGLTNFADTQSFNGSTIGSNWIYDGLEEGDSMGQSWSATFSADQKRVGFFADSWGADGITIQTYLGGVLTGSVFFPNPNEDSPDFFGVEDTGLFDRITVTTQTNDNGFFAMDNFRFDSGDSVSVPDGGTTVALLGFALSGIGLLRRKI